MDATFNRTSLYSMLRPQPRTADPITVPSRSTNGRGALEAAGWLVLRFWGHDASGSISSGPSVTLKALHSAEWAGGTAKPFSHWTRWIRSSPTG
jgi:hypothetical protein